MLPAQCEAALQQLLCDLRSGKRAKELALLIPQAFLLQAGIDPGPQQHRVERFREIVLGAHLDAFHHPVQLIGGRGHDDRYVSQLWILKQGLQHLKAIQLRHFDVEQQQVIWLGSEHLEGLSAVLGSRHLVARAAPGRAKAAGD